MNHNAYHIVSEAVEKNKDKKPEKKKPKKNHSLEKNAAVIGGVEGGILGGMVGYRIRSLKWNKDYHIAHELLANDLIKRFKYSKAEALARVKTNPVVYNHLIKLRTRYLRRGRIKGAIIGGVAFAALLSLVAKYERKHIEKKKNEKKKLEMDRKKSEKKK